MIYHGANFWIVEEISCATLGGEDGSWQGSTIMVACCILHNLTVNLREPEPKDCNMDDEGCAGDLHTQYHGREIGNTVREHIAYNFFNI